MFGVIDLLAVHNLIMLRAACLTSLYLIRHVLTDICDLIDRELRKKLAINEENVS